MERETSVRSKNLIFLPLTSVPTAYIEPLYGVASVISMRVSRQPSRHSMKWRAMSPPIEWPITISFAFLFPDFCRQLSSQQG